jgi:uncharacterized protein (TIGR03118 family)
MNMLSLAILRHSLAGAFRSRWLSGLALAIGLLVALAQPAKAQNAFIFHILTTDIQGYGNFYDANLVNPWGIALTETGAFVTANTGSGTATMYAANGMPLPTVINIPMPPGGGPGPSHPIGIVANSSVGFEVSPGVPATYIFSTEEGTISAWASGPNAVLKIDNSPSGSGVGAVYKGLAIGTNGSGTYIYAPDFQNKKVDVYDANFNLVTLAGSFTDPNLPEGYAPFNVQNINGQLYVGYAAQAGVGFSGYVSLFDTSGNLIRRFASDGPLDAPWGFALAPTPFGPFSGALLVASFGSGRINAYNPTNGALLGLLKDPSGDPFFIEGLWAITFGNGQQGSDTNTLYFVAGVSRETNGVFGSLTTGFSAAASVDAYLKRNLVSDLPEFGDFLDGNVRNPWGIAFSATGPFWIADHRIGRATAYTGTGAPVPVVVDIPAAAGGATTGTPTGIIANPTAGFTVTAGVPAAYIFATEDGTISAWASGSSAVVKVDRSAAGAVYKGLAFGTNSGGACIFATDFSGGKIDVFDDNFAPVSLAGSFTDPALPAGFAPFGIQNLNGQLYVTYAKQDALKKKDVRGAGNGYVTRFSTSGILVGRFASGGVLNSPWGLTRAPATFGAYGGAVLVGNVGDGRIHAFNPTNAAFLGTLGNPAGEPLVVMGLWGLTFGNDAQAGDSQTLYFTASRHDENNGIFGSITPVIPTFLSVTNEGPATRLTWLGGAAPMLLQQKFSLSDAGWFNLLTTTNQSVTVARGSSNGFFRLVNQATNTVLPFAAQFSGGAEVPPIATPATGTGVFSLEGSNFNYHVTYAGLSGAATSVTLEGPAEANATGPVLATLTTPTGTAGTITGSVTLTSTQIAYVLANTTYLNIRSTVNTGGEIRGQVMAP